MITYQEAEQLRIAGLLHDIGKNGIEPDSSHAEKGFKILEKEGLTEIGKIVRTHTVAKESEEFEGRIGFEPITLEEKLLTYADCHVKHDKVVSFKERYDDVIERRKNDSRGYEILIKARSRIQKIIDEVNGILEKRNAGIPIFSEVL